MPATNMMLRPKTIAEHAEDLRAEITRRRAELATLEAVLAALQPATDQRNGRSRPSGNGAGATRSSTTRNGTTRRRHRASQPAQTAAE